jgi:hypothetical protein
MLTPSKPLPSIKPRINTKGEDFSDLPLRAKGEVEPGFRNTIPFGGQYHSAIGVSTTPQRTAILDWFEAEIRECASKPSVPF